MKIIVFSRFPRFDKLRWKQQLLKELDLLGCKPIAIIYDSTSIKEQIQSGIKRYGLSNALSRVIKLSRIGSHFERQSVPLKLESVAKKMDVPVYYVVNHNSEYCVNLLRKLTPDLIFLWGTRIIKKPVLLIPKLGTVNIHYSILPRIRGMNVTEWSILLGKQAGVTVHLVSAEVDQGDILYFEKIEVLHGDSLETIRKKCQNAAIRCFVTVIKCLQKNTLKPLKQAPEEGAQYFIMNRLLKKLVIRKLRGNISNKFE